MREREAIRLSARVQKLIALPGIYTRSFEEHGCDSASDITILLGEHIVNDPFASACDRVISSCAMNGFRK